MVTIDVSHFVTRTELELIVGVVIVRRETSRRYQILLHTTEVNHSIHVMRDISIHAQVVIQALGFLVEDNAVNRELDTLVVGRTDVAVLVVISTQTTHCILEYEISSAVPIQVNRSAQTLVEETEVDTEIARCCGLPFEIVVGCNNIRTAICQLGIKQTIICSR